MITIQVSGNLTANAIVKTVQGKQVLNFTIASNYKDEVTFINCAIWNKPELAEYFYKGRAVTASGVLKLRTYVGKDGSMHTSLNLSVGVFQLFGKNIAKAAEASPVQEQPQTFTNEEEVEPLPF